MFGVFFNVCTLLFVFGLVDTNIAWSWGACTRDCLFRDVCSTFGHSICMIGTGLGWDGNGWERMYQDIVQRIK